jgi:hypothetical protein
MMNVFSSRHLDTINNNISHPPLPPSTIHPELYPRNAQENWAWNDLPSPLYFMHLSNGSAYGHIVHANVTASFLHDDLFLDYYSYSHAQMSVTLDINSYSLVIRYSLNVVGYNNNIMLLYIAVYKFMCSQSPHAMKGLVIGTFFAIKGIFQLLGVVVIYYLPFILGWKNILRSFPSCGFIYYLIKAIIALIGIVAYTCVARP